MSQENVDTLREVYEQWEQGGLQAGADLYDPDLVFISRAGLPDAEGKVFGLEATAELMRRWMVAWTNYSQAAEEFIDAGDSVVVAVRHKGRGRHSGVPTEQLNFWVWTFRGPSVIRIEEFLDRDEALEAVGLRDEDLKPAE